MIKAALIDDEQNSIDALKWELEVFQEYIEVVYTSTLPTTAINELRHHDVDILFLDVSMPTLTGFEFLKKISPYSFEVIFTTAYDQYAVKAFEVNAYDYLLKPVNHDDLKRVLDKVIHDKAEKDNHANLIQLFQTLSKSKTSKTIAVPVQDGLRFIETDTIIRCESDSNYTKIFIKDEKSLLISKTLKEIEAMIELEHFYRIHHSHLVNLNFLKKYVRGKAGSIILKDGSQIPISRSKKNDFLSGI